jgi:hypothetical protein
MVPFDGDRYFDTILASLGLSKVPRKYVRTAASVIALGLLGLNLVLSYAQYGTIFPK